jgi:hypothetical protein
MPARLAADSRSASAAQRFAPIAPNAAAVSSRSAPSPTAWAVARRENRLASEGELAVLADDVVRVEPKVELHPAARSDFDALVNRYLEAQAAVDYADQPVDLGRVGRVVAEARYSMDRARAIIEGREPPAPPDELQRPGQHGEPAVRLDDDRQPAYVGYPGRVQAAGSAVVTSGGGEFGGGDFGGGDFGVAESRGTPGDDRTTAALFTR